MSEDFPAAHSMDSVWFAVDQDGRVAIFSTGEAGAMPEDAAGEEEGNHDLYQALAKLPKKSQEIVEPYRHQGRGEAVGHASTQLVTAENAWGQYIFLLDSPDPLKAEIDDGKGQLMRADKGCAVFFSQVTYELVKRLHDEKLCRGCFFHFRSEEGQKEGSMPERGLYSYGHTCENWISGPYGREASPSEPITVFELPKVVRERIVKLPVKFADTPYLQPAEHVECFSWEVAWLELDGKHVHAFPEHEQEAQEMYGKEGDLGDMDLIFVKDDE
jgi:hypothetical protein